MDIYKQESINSSKLAVLVLAIPASHRMDASWKEAWTHSVKNICKMQVAPCDWCWESVWCQCSNSWFWSAERIRAATCTSESVGQSQWVGVNMQFTHLSKQGMAVGKGIPVLTKQVRVSYHISKNKPELIHTAGRYKIHIEWENWDFLHYEIQNHFQADFKPSDLIVI